MSDEVRLNRLHETGLSLGEPTTVEVPGGVRITKSGEYVPVADRLVPTFVEIRIEGDASGPTTVGRVEIRDGAPRVVEIRFVSEPGQGEVRPGDLRVVDVDAMLLLAAGFAVRVVEAVGGRVEYGADEAVVDESLRALRGARRNRRLTTEFLQEVAELYRENFDRAPTKAVRERWMVSPRVASGWVQEARARGLLPPTSPGKKRV